MFLVVSTQGIMKYTCQCVNESRDDEFAKIRANSPEEFMNLCREWLISVGLDTMALLHQVETLISKGRRVLLVHLAELVLAGFWLPVMFYYRTPEMDPQIGYPRLRARPLYHRRSHLRAACPGSSSSLANAPSFGPSSASWIRTRSRWH